MEYFLRKFEVLDLSAAKALWNEIIDEQIYFPGDRRLSEDQAHAMFKEQTLTCCAFVQDSLVGLYVLHPNGIGRLAHVANASYAVKRHYRGRGLGRALVLNSIENAKAAGFHALQFNAVVACNTPAITLYLQLGFRIVGTIAGGYRAGDNKFSDMLIFFKSWQ